jgi:hypothetical protein
MVAVKWLLRSHVEVVSSFSCRGKTVDLVDGFADGHFTRQVAAN